jgi:hypothetical protein
MPLLEGSGDRYLEFRAQYVDKFPIPNRFSSWEHRERLASLVERTVTLHRKLSEAKISQEKTIIQHQIEATDRQIDQLVYELYGLTEEEIKLVEKATQ